MTTTDRPASDVRRAMTPGEQWAIDRYVAAKEEATRLLCELENAQSLLVEWQMRAEAAERRHVDHDASTERTPGMVATIPQAQSDSRDLGFGFTLVKTYSRLPDYEQYDLYRNGEPLGVTMTHDEATQFGLRVMALLDVVHPDDAGLGTN